MQGLDASGHSGTHGIRENHARSRWPLRRLPCLRQYRHERQPVRLFCMTKLPAHLVLLLVVGCTQGTPGSSSVSGFPRPETPSSLTPPSAADAGLAQVPEIVARLQPSVVTIIVPGGNGSGVVYTAEGLILTNEHVVRGNRDVVLAFADGQRTAGTVKATDPVSDLALVQAHRGDLPPVEFADTLPQIGSLAIVIGSPLGFQNTVTVGVISGLHREIPGSAAQGQALVDLIQTDAAVSPGNSGGAVVDATGRVVGISEAYIPPQVGAVALGFAIPATTAVDVAEQLRTAGRARHAFAGLVPAPITPAIAEELGLRGAAEGVIVAGVARGGPADRAGLRPGDVITALDGEPTRTPEEFLAALRAREPGDTVTVTVHGPRQADRKVTLTLIDRPASASR